MIAPGLPVFGSKIIELHGAQAPGDAIAEPNGHFGGRGDDQLRSRAQRALRVGIEGAHGLDLIAKEVNAHRQPGSGRKYVHDAAAVGKLARPFHERRRFVSQADEASGQGVEVGDGAGREGEVVALEFVHRHEAAHQGPCRGDHDDGIAVGGVHQPAHHGHSPREQVMIDRQHGEGRLVHVGEMQDGDVPGPHADVVRQLASPRFVGGHDDERAPETLDQQRRVHGLERVTQLDSERLGARLRCGKRRGQRRLGGEFSCEVG